MLMFDAPFPDFLVSLGHWMTALSFGIDVVMPACAGLGASFYSRFNLGMLLLVIVVLVLLAPAVIQGRRAGLSRRDILVFGRVNSPRCVFPKARCALR